MSLPAQGMPEMPMEFDDFGRTAVVSEVMSGLPGESRACRTGATARRRAVYAPGDVAVAGSAGVHGSDIGNHNGNGENVIHGPSTVAGSHPDGEVVAGQEVSDLPAPVEPIEVADAGAGYGRGSAAQGDVEPGSPCGALRRDGTPPAPVHDPGAVSEDERRRSAWVYLSRVVQGPCAPLSALIESVGVLEAARAVRERELPQSLRAAVRARRDVDRAAADIEAVRRSGGRVVTPDDEEWPAWRMLGLTRSEIAREPDGAVPLVLWVRGSRSLLEVTERALAVVGSRCSTGYGEHVTGDLVGDLAARGWTVVSGAAFGIDAVAHRVALAMGAPTVAVLACGVDRSYPAQHHRLLDEIAETGLVVSEYPPGAAARKHCFLARNRLIAALADGVLVVEAGVRSGARNTVKWARRLGRPALAVPGPVTSAASAGCHQMIREGEALLVSRVEEVIAEAGPLQLGIPGVAATPAADITRQAHPDSGARPGADEHREPGRCDKPSGCDRVGDGRDFREGDSREGDHPGTAAHERATTEQAGAGGAGAPGRTEETAAGLLTRDGARTGDEATVYAAVPRVGGCLPGELVERTGLELATVRAVLVALELAGLVTADDAGWRRNARARPSGGP